jgi:dethiobiotin synthetase
MIARFVTATGTGIGKTLVTAAMAYQLKAAGKCVRVLKPVLTGLAETPLAESDPALLLRAIGDQTDPAAIAPFRFEAPLSPDMAALREGKTLDFDALIDFCRRALDDPADAVLIEGIGGVMVPLTENRTALDWFAALHIPVVLVAGSYLGTLSHTLTALSALRQARIAVSGVVVSESEGSTVGLGETVQALERWAAPAPVLALPRLQGAEPWRQAPDLSTLWI